MMVEFFASPNFSNNVAKFAKLSAAINSVLKVAQ